MLEQIRQSNYYDYDDNIASLGLLTYDQGGYDNTRSRSSADRMQANTWEGYYQNNKDNPLLWREFGTLSPDESSRFQKVMDELRNRGVKTVVDAACGIGRHTELLLQRGFAVKAFDLSISGLEIMKTKIPYYDHYIGSGQLTVANFDMFETWPDNFRDVDAVLGMQALYHGYRSEVVKVLQHIKRDVLTNRGVLGFSASKLKGRAISGDFAHASSYAKDHQILADGTHIPLAGREKGLPHYYISWDEIPAMMNTEVGFPDMAVYDWNGLGYYFIWGYNTDQAI